MAGCSTEKHGTGGPTDGEGPRICAECESLIPKRQRRKTCKDSAVLTACSTDATAGTAAPQDAIRRHVFGENTRVSAVIPSLDGDRGGNVAKLLADLRAQTAAGLEAVVVAGIKPQGRAINLGVSAAAGEFIVVCDDDSRIPDTTTLATLIDTLAADRAIGMCGASISQPPGANRFQRWAARDFPRLNMRPVAEITDSDMPCHGCCAMRKDVFVEVGREREDILRGLDPELRQRLRGAGYRVVLVPGASAHHPLPPTPATLLRMFFRNGRGSAYAQRYQPDLVFDTSEDTAWRGQTLRRSWLRRALWFPLRSLGCLLRGRLLRVLADSAYAAGYAWEWLTGDRPGQSKRAT
jgi:GT2 family glycosyltransferase